MFEKEIKEINLEIEEDYGIGDCGYYRQKYSKEEINYMKLNARILEIEKLLGIKLLINGKDENWRERD